VSQTGLIDSTSARVSVVALTGGPGGGKSELLRRLQAVPAMGAAVVVLEEAIRAMRFVRLGPRSREFQCALVATQAASEESLTRALADSGKKLLVTHRGTLDPCAFWQSFGNSRESFFEMTRTTLEDHYRRYALVLHMESAAVRVPEAYARWPHSHRPEDVAQAARLDTLLGESWCRHPNYVKLEGASGFEGKLRCGVEVVLGLLRRHSPA
jgi:nicotinamide riboside kinase